MIKDLAKILLSKQEKISSKRQLKLLPLKSYKLRLIKLKWRVKLKFYVLGMVESLGNQISSLENEKFEVDLKLNNKNKEYEDREAECLSDAAGYE